jgi:hypothetical protein
MAGTDEKGAAGAAGGAPGSKDDAVGADASGGEEAAELRAEEESAKAMEAEVPHPQGYDDAGQEPPSGSGQGQPS